MKFQVYKLDELHQIRIESPESFSLLTIDEQNMARELYSYNTYAEVIEYAKLMARWYNYKLIDNTTNWDVVKSIN